jgi:hypothetical protein
VDEHILVARIVVVLVHAVDHRIGHARTSSPRAVAPVAAIVGILPTIGLVKVELVT